MKIAEAKCSNCGGSLKVDADAKSGVCPYCGTCYITQDAINNYNTTVNQNTFISADKLDINIVEGKFNNLYSNAIDSWNAHDYEDAYNKFTKALEIVPDSTECALFKALCLVLLKDNLSGATEVYKRIYNRLNMSDEKDSQFAKKFLKHLNVITNGQENYIMKKFTPDVNGTWAIDRAWHGLEQVLNARLFIVAFAEKIYNADQNYKNNYSVYMKNLSATYGLLVQKWKRLMPIDNRYHVSDYHPRREEFLESKKELVKKIKEIDPEYKEEEKKEGCYIATCVYGSYDCRKCGPCEGIEIILWILLGTVNCS